LKTKGDRSPFNLYSMSNLANKTDFKVLDIISKCLKQLDHINTLNLKVTKIDDFEISLATNMLKSVIDNNEQVININPVS
jgi:hypothetical protein